MDSTSVIWNYVQNRKTRKENEEALVLVQNDDGCYYYDCDYATSMMVVLPARPRH